MGYIQKQFEKIITHAIAHYAKEFNVDKTALQIQFHLKNIAVVNSVDGSPITSMAEPGPVEAGYKISVDYKVKKEIKAIDVIHPGKNYRIDFTGMSQRVHPFIAKALLELAGENNLDPAKTSVFCVLVTKGELERVMLYLYNDTNPVKRLDMATLFSDEKIVV